MSLTSVLKSFVRRTQAQIRDDALALLKSGFQAIGRDIDIEEGSDAWMIWGVAGLLLEAINQQAAINVAQAFPDTATQENLDHHARLYGLTRKPDVDAILELTVTGTVGSTWSAGDVLTSADGITYTVRFGYGGTIPGGGSSTTQVLATPLGGLTTTGLGRKTSKSVGSVLTWNSPGAGINPTATVLSIIRAGVDRESDKDLSGRILGIMREKPAGFNRSEVRAILEKYSSVSEAYVYPAYSALTPDGYEAQVGTDNTSGNALAIVLGYAPDRILSDAELDNMRIYFDEYIPATLLGGSVDIYRPPVATQNIEATITLSAEYSWPFTGSYSIDAASTTTNVKVTTDPTTVGAGQVNVGDLVAVQTNNVRGNFEVGRVASVNSTTIVVDTALSAVPFTTGKVYPAPANWELMLEAVLSVFDKLGPGEGVGPTSLRYPKISDRGPDTLFVSQITASLVRTVTPAGEEVGVDGVTAVTVATPAGDVTAASLELIVPGSIYFTE